MANNLYPLKKDAYLTFDSLSLKEHIKKALSDDGIVTDHVYEGSYLSTIIDIFCFTFNNLIYYLNNTATESMFSDAQIYENINRIVKTIGYNPIGNQTSILSFSCSASPSVENGFYLIPRYSYINLGSISYSFNNDITFSKTLSGQLEYLKDFSSEKVLYQGKFIEYPKYIATGEENEIVYLLPGDNVIVDHFNIDVYVKNVSDGKWKQYFKTNSLYLENNNALKYEIRLNEKKHYEIKFGNNINGKKLNTGDEVAIYYLKSDGTLGEVGSNSLKEGVLMSFSTSQFSEILTDINLTTFNIISNNEMRFLNFDNDAPSTYYSLGDTVENIRENAPASFRSQYRLVTINDYTSYIKTNYSNLIHDVKVYDNWDYITKYLKYFYDLGITNPNNDSRVRFNQVNFADSCNFNNVYAFLISKITPSSKNVVNYLSPALKELIISSTKDIKTITSEFLIVDPVFIAVSFIISNNLIIDETDINNSKLIIIKNENTRRDDNSLKLDVYNIFKSYFSRENVKLGQTIDINYLTNQILTVDGVKSFYIGRTDDKNIKYEGLSLLLWNTNYLKDKIIINKNYILDEFKFPYLYDQDNFINKISVIKSGTIYENIEY